MSFQLLPGRPVELRKPGVASHYGVDQGWIKAISQRQHLPVQVGSANHKDNRIAGIDELRCGCQRRFDGVNYLASGRLKTGVAGNDDIGSIRERAPQRFKGFSPHDHGVSARKRLEVREVRRQSPGESVA